MQNSTIDDEIKAEFALHGKSVRQTCTMILSKCLSVLNGKESLCQVQWYIPLLSLVLLYPSHTVVMLEFISFRTPPFMRSLILDRGV